MKYTKTHWKPGDRCSFGGIEGGYESRDGRSRFDFGTVLLVTLVKNDHPIVLIARSGSGDLLSRAACYVHDEWDYYPEAAFRQWFHENHRRAMYGEGDIETGPSKGIPVRVRIHNMGRAKPKPFRDTWGEDEEVDA